VTGGAVLRAACAGRLGGWYPTVGILLVPAAGEPLRGHERTSGSGMKWAPARRWADVSFHAARKRGRVRRGPRIGRAPRAVGLAMIACGLAAGCSAATAPNSQHTPQAAAAGPFVYVADKGRNEISQFDAPPSASGAPRPLTPATVASGPFPAAIAISAQGTSAYVVDLGPVDAPAKKVSQYSINPATGTLTPKSPATVATGGLPQGMAITPDGTSAYVVNAETNSVWQYSINPATGKLTPKSPATAATRGGSESVTIAPDGNSAYVTNPVDHTISQHSINSATGKLSPKSPATVATGPGPHDLAIAPDGKNAYVVTVADNTVSQYTINPTTGKIAPMSPATVATPSGSIALAITPDPDLPPK
jgi:DNA-binding beta-propeller fold protein YncE